MVINSVERKKCFKDCTLSRRIKDGKLVATIDHTPYHIGKITDDENSSQIIGIVFSD